MPESERTEAQAEVTIHGQVEAGLEPVRDAFLRNFSDGEVGASFAVWRDGRALTEVTRVERDAQG